MESILATAKRDGYVMGHLGYGAHRIFADPCRYFTMLREPKARVISLWRHAAVSSNAYYHYAAKGLSFQDFLAQCEPLELDNGLVRFLSGDPTGDNVFINPKPFGTLDQTDLQRALYNLEYNLEGFGLMEQFDRSLLLLKPLMGLRYCFYTPLNVARYPEAGPSFPDKSLSLVSLDQALYAAGKRIWQERINNLPDSFEAKLKLFQGINNVLGPIFGLKTNIKRRLFSLSPPLGVDAIQHSSH